MKKGQGGVITIVLIILLVLAAIVVVWNVVYSTIKKSSEQVNVDAFSNKFEIQKSKVYLNGNAKINVRKESGSDNATSMKFIFYAKDGSSFSVTRDYAPAELETKEYNFTSDEITSSIDSVSVIPFFKNTPGFEIKESDSIVARDSNGERILEPIDGIVSWWKFDGDMKDSAGGNDESKFGDAKIQDSSLFLDGIGDYIQTSSITTHGNSESASLWVKHATGGSSNVLFSQSWLRRLFHNHWIFVDNSSVYYYPSAEGINDGNWHQAAYTINKTHIVTYVDGNIKSTISLNRNYMKDEIGFWWIGRVCSDTRCDYYFNGSIDDVMIFNRALSEDEIKGLYNMQKP